MDFLDEAQQKETREREASIARARYKKSNADVKFCVSCSDKISPERKAVNPGAIRCVSCQEACE